MASQLQELLRQSHHLTLDGGMGSEIEKLNIIEDDELWSADALIHHPQIITDLHAKYIQSGADIITTATYQSNPIFLKKVGITDDLTTKAVRLAMQARDEQDLERPILIAGSIGPYGATLNDGSEYTGSYDLSKESFKDYHKPQIERLVDANVDLLVLETVPNLNEIKAVSEIISNDFNDQSLLVSLSLNDKYNLADGTELKSVVEYLNDCHNVEAVGVNCIDITKISDILKKLGSLTDKPILVYPNNGDRFDTNEQRWIVNKKKPTFSSLVPTWKSLNATIIGGCCRTTPDDIRQIAETINL